MEKKPLNKLEVYQYFNIIKDIFDGEIISSENVNDFSKFGIDI